MVERPGFRQAMIIREGVQLLPLSILLHYEALSEFYISCHRVLNICFLSLSVGWVKVTTRHRKNSTDVRFNAFLFPKGV